MDFIDALAIVLSIVSLIITVIGFFASLKFYRDGVELQRLSNDALTKIEEKTQFIQGQVGGMFEKTLNVALGKKEILSESFAELNEQLENTKTRIIDETLNQIDAAGEQERKRLTELVNDQINVIRRKLETTQESVETLTSDNLDVRSGQFMQSRFSKGHASIYSLLEKNIFNLMKEFKGQKVPGYLFNIEGDITLPTFKKLHANSIITPYEGVKREVDILGENGGTKWIVEVKGRIIRELHTLDELVYLSQALKANAWLVSYSDVPGSIKKAASQRGILLSGEKELLELRHLIHVQGSA